MAVKKTEEMSRAVSTGARQADDPATMVIPKTPKLGGNWALLRDLTGNNNGNGNNKYNNKMSGLPVTAVLSFCDVKYIAAAIIALLVRLQQLQSRL